MESNDEKLDFLKIVQMSDMHVFADDKADLFGVNTNKNFLNVIDQIKKTELSDTDLILLTGDLSQDETEGSYRKIVAALDGLNIPIYWIPGNHDDISMVSSIFSTGNNFFSSRRLITELWDFVFLNTKLDGTATGFLSDEELTALRNEVTKPNNNKPIALVMHHHPSQVNTPLVDNYILSNNKEFWDIVTNTNVKLVICGHVHHDYSFKHNGITIESAPATSYQFTKGTTDLHIDKIIGCKIYHLNNDQYTAQPKTWPSQ